MKSTRFVLKLGFNKRVEVEPGVWENEVTSKKVKAEQEHIFQQRVDQAKLQGTPINARFRIRGHYDEGSLDYVEFKDQRFKVLSITPQLENHYTVIELGELM